MSTRFQPGQQDYVAVLNGLDDDVQAVKRAMSGQVQASWTQSDPADPSYILNKPDIAALARGAALTGLSTATASAVLATDTVLGAIGKLQALVTQAAGGSTAYAPLNSPAFTGVPTVPTAAPGTNTLQAASTAYVRSELAALIGAVPSTLDTLVELGAALGNDANFAATTATSLGFRLRVDTAAQGLSTQQKTNAKTNLGLENVENTSDANKPVSTATSTALGQKANKANDTLTKPTIKGYIEQFQALNASLSHTINTDNGTLIEITTTGNTAVILPAPVAGVSYSLIVIYGGAHTLTFSVASGTLGWAGKSTGTNTAPTPTMLTGKKDIYSFLCGGAYTIGRDGGRNA